MIIISHDYSNIDEPKMTNNFIIRSEYVNKVWDITDREIGVSFIPTYDTYKYSIRLEGEHKNLLAKDILKMILGDETITINGKATIR